MKAWDSIFMKLARRTLGRVISEDELIPNPGNPRNFNRYTYAHINSILFNDPIGHFGFKSADASSKCND
ncbi:MAG: hypothetical protein NPIRA06_02520 [Nitrospirales bacterium]|nr:MAG: hypothetical protein NPIRA06_02520 [Nitrospirales bacterium]